MAFANSQWLQVLLGLRPHLPSSKRHFNLRSVLPSSAVSDLPALPHKSLCDYVQSTPGPPGAPLLVTSAQSSFRVRGQPRGLGIRMRPPSQGYTIVRLVCMGQAGAAFGSHTY